MSADPEGGRSDRFEKPFLEHLDDLRRMIFRCVGWLVAGMLVATPLAPRILELVKRPLSAAGFDPDSLLKIIHIAGGFGVAMKVIFWSGMLLAFPGILIAVCHFVFPGLTPRERRTVTGSLGFAGGLFAAGVCMGYFTTVPVAIRMLTRVTHWMRSDYDFLELGNYAAFVLKLLLAFGLAFELPVVVYALGSMGIVSSGMLREKRRHVVVVLMAVAMFLTPQDPYTMLLMGLPLVGLYEISIWLIWLKERRASRSVA